ncbi:MAG: 5-methyltetrahydropteroyltriglutamate--homocysteine S-methyltransferase, partial [Candidatus Rokuibacteriota bacterium]
KADLTRRLEEASKFLPLDQLAVSPQCWFSSTLEGNDVSVEQQRAKLRFCVELAREVWGDR